MIGVETRPDRRLRPKGVACDRPMGTFYLRRRLRPQLQGHALPLLSNGRNIREGIGPRKIHGPILVAARDPCGRILSWRTQPATARNEEPQIRTPYLPARRSASTNRPDPRAFDSRSSQATLLQLSATALRAISAYSGFNSTPRHPRPSSAATTQVVPDPAKGSSTSSPGSEHASTKGLTICEGNAA